MKSWIVAAASVVLSGGAAHAADLGTFEPAPTPPPAAAYSWTGVYVGLQGGYSWGSAPQTYDNALILLPINTQNPHGWGGGIEVGANYQYNSGLVVGLEADATFANITDTVDDNLGNANFPPPPNNTVTATVDLAANLRGRVGFAFDRTLLFAAGGVAVAHNKVDVTAGDLHDQATLWGWTAGGGIEQAVTNKISVKVEYLYTQHGPHTWFAGQPFSSTGSDSGSTVRAGLNLHF